MYYLDSKNPGMHFRKLFYFYVFIYLYSQFMSCLLICFCTQEFQNIMIERARIGNGNLCKYLKSNPKL